MKPIILGGTNGVTLLYPNPTTPANSMEAEITNAFNSGLKVGNIRRAFLCNSLTADRSVKGGLLTVNGTITETVNAGGVNVYSGFSATNYFSEASHADWNALGTGDFSIVMSGVKWGTAGAGRSILNWGNADVGALWIGISSIGNLQVYVYTTGWIALIDTGTYTDSATHSLAVTRVGSTVTLYVDGATAAMSTSSLTISNTTAPLRIGNDNHSAGVQPWTGGQVAQVRISATAPTPEQIKHMYETERKLFETGAQALLSNSASVSDLRYDKKSGMYAVTNGTNTDLFKDLVRVDSAATSATIATPVTTLSGNRVLAPAVDIGSELSTIKTVHNRRRVLLDFNVVVNGKFSGTANWTYGAGWSNPSSAAVASSATGAITNSSALVAGKIYVVTYTISSYTSGSIVFTDNSGGSLTTRSSAGTLTETLTAIGTAISINTVAAATLTVDNFFIRESTDTLPPGFKPTKVWAGGLLQEDGTDYDVTFDGFLYGISFFIEPATNVQVEGEYI